MRNFQWLVVAAILVSGAAYAEDTSSGCGLGWQVSQRMSLFSSSIRSTTDAILPNTFSMTSGTSGCAKHSIVKGDDAAVYFAVNSYDSIRVEMAEGKGEFLHSFARTLGCDALASERFAQFTQSRYRAIMENGAGDGIGFYKAVRTEMLTDPILTLACVPSSTT